MAQAKGLMSTSPCGRSDSSIGGRRHRQSCRLGGLPLHPSSHCQLPCPYLEIEIPTRGGPRWGQAGPSGAGGWVAEACAVRWPGQARRALRVWVGVARTLDREAAACDVARVARREHLAAGGVAVRVTCEHAGMAEHVSVM